MKNTEMITVVNQDGETVELELIDIVNIDQNEYVIVGPKNSNEAYAYKTIVNNGEKEYISIGNGEEFKKVLTKFNS